MKFKIAVVDKDGKFLNYLCEEHRNVGSIWLEELEFMTRERAEEHIKEHHGDTPYVWQVKEIKAYDPHVVIVWPDTKTVAVQMYEYREDAETKYADLVQLHIPKIALARIVKQHGEG